MYTKTIVTIRTHLHTHTACDRDPEFLILSIRTLLMSYHFARARSKAQAGATRASALVGHGVSLRRSGFRLKDAEWEVGFKSDLAWASDLGSGPGY